jgi:hypothetical protein
MKVFNISKVQFASKFPRPAIAISHPLLQLSPVDSRPFKLCKLCAFVNSKGLWFKSAIGCIRFLFLLAFLIQESASYDQHSID